VFVVCVGNALKDILQLIEHFIIRKPQDTEVPTLEEALSPAVSCGRKPMYCAIQLNDKSSLRAEEIDNERSDRNLPLELHTMATPVLQLSPENPLRERLAASELPRTPERLRNTLRILWSE
jgi:hypothetical protein